LRKTRVFQLFSNCYEKIMHAPSYSKNQSGSTLMRMMVADQYIGYQSPLYDKGIRQFRTNLDETLSLLDSYHVPVFVSTLVTNEKDFKPFMDIPPDSAKVPAFNKNFNLGLGALAVQDTPVALTYLKKANDLYDRDATCNFYLGRIASANHDYARAGIFFTKARDLDGLRFRAPSEINRVIRQLSTKYPFVHLVDTQAAFESNSASHIIGNDLMLEHVHPNLKGYGIMSDAFYQAIKNNHLIGEEKQTEMSLDQLESQMPVTRMDSLSGLYRISKLKMSWPFQEITMQDSVGMPSEERRLAHDMVFGRLLWSDAIDSLYNYYLGKNDLAGAVTVMETLVLEHPQEVALYIKTAMLFGKMNDLPNACLYFKRSFAIAPSVELARYLFVIYFKLDDPPQAIPYLDYCIKNSAQAAVLVAIKSYGKEIIELKKKYIPGSPDMVISHRIASLYLKMGNKEAAEKYGRPSK
ncbi:MAG TPA: hypothetical protein VKR53_11365, partial [Puia sp.]|nr:hypothetical protein [Puia sp.]